MGKPYAPLTVLSSPVLFKGNFLRHNDNIHDCFTLQRKRIVSTVERPWAAGLARLLTDRRLKKGDLADLAGVRAGTISAVANSPKAPDIATLQRLADGFTRHDRLSHPQAPAVGLWEFFVSDEQAALLRESAHKQQQLVAQDQLIDRVMGRLAPLVTSVLQQEIAAPAPQQTTPQVSASEHAPPAAETARGRLQRRRRAS